MHGHLWYKPLVSANTLTMQTAKWWLSFDTSAGSQMYSVECPPFILDPIWAYTREGQILSLIQQYCMIRARCNG